MTCHQKINLDPEGCSVDSRMFLRIRKKGPLAWDPPGVIAEYDDKYKVNLKGYKGQGVNAALIPRDSQFPRVVQNCLDRGGSSPKYDIVSVEPNRP